MENNNNNNNNRVPISKSELMNLREEKGYTIPQIARHFNLSENQAKRALQACGISTKAGKRIKFQIIE